ncbi:MAG: class I SAM-dependent methyltransferase, partial [Gemmatimonadota bacterium]
RACGGPVLELGCGTGRVLLPVARAGVAVTGLDVSEGMLAVCRRHLAAEPEEVQARVALHRGDMRDFDLGRTFPLIITPFRPFQHLAAAADQLACLARVRAHLEPGGRFILDVYNPYLERLVEDRSREWTDEPEFTLGDGRRVQRRFRVAGHDRASQVLQVELLYYVTHPDGRQERLVHAFGMRYFFRYEVEHLLARSGLQVEAVYCDYDRAPMGTKYPGEIIAVARRG